MQIIRKLLASTAALALAATPVNADNFQLMGVGSGSGAVAAYSGPGDVQATGWVTWSGLRAFSASTAGTKSASVRCVTAGTTNDINTLTNGNFDEATLQALCPSDTYFITKRYDKTGNANDFTQVTAANQPQLFLNQLNGSTLPDMHYTRASTNFITTGTLAFSAPYTVITEAQVSTAGGFEAVIAFPNQFKVAYSSSTNTQMQNCGTTLNVTAASNTWATIAGSCSNGASAVYTNSSSATGVGGAVSVNAGLRVGADDGPNPLDGNEVEGGFLSVGLNSTQIGNLHTNSCTYWGVTC